MPLVLVPLTALLLAFFLLAYHNAINMTVRPHLNVQADKNESFLKTTVFAPYRLIARWASKAERRIRGAVSHFALAHLPVARRWLVGHTQRVLEQAREFSTLSNDVADALALFRHRTMPRAINAKVAPVKAQAHGAAVVAGRSISLGQRERRERTRSIDRLRKVVLPLALGFAGIDAFVRGKHAARHHADHTRTIPQIRDRDIPRLKTREKAIEQRLAKHGSRLSRLEKALGGGLLAGLLVRTIARRWPWLFCRNWKKVGSRVCGMHSGLLNFLLGLGGAMFVFAELCRFIETVAVVAGRVLPKLIEPMAETAAALCDGRHTAAPALPLNTTALPRVDSPLAL